MNRFLRAFVAFLVLSAAPALAAMPVGKDMANSYYANCLDKRDERMTEDSQKAMCACTAAKMMESMTVEDMTVMSSDTPDSRLMLNKMLIEVYAPCMSFPVQDLVETQCLNDEKVATIGFRQTKKSLCHCMAEKTGQWFTTRGKYLMFELLQKNPNITDPISPVMESKSFKEESYSNLRACLKGE